jgi:hypothetical protein
MRLPSSFLPVSLGLILALPACREKDQYNNELPPPQPDAKEATLIKGQVAPDEDQGQTGTEPGAGVVEPGQADEPTSPEDILALVGNWNNQPVVWNESAGNIVIGETMFNDWNDQFNRFYDAAPFRPAFGAFYFENSSVPFNTSLKGNRQVATTINMVYLLQNYKGPLSFPKGDEFVDLRMGQSLSDLGFFSISNGDLIQDPADDSTRGREFLINFYNKLIKQDEGGDDFDCFAAGRCNYIVTPDQWGWTYNSPRNETGYIYMGKKNNTLIEAMFRRPDLPPAGVLAQPGVAINLMDGSFVAPGGESILTLDDSYGYVKEELGLPKANWFENSMTFIGEFLGLNLLFQKSETDRLADDNYVSPAPTDYFVGFSANSKASNVLTLQGANGESKRFAFFDEARKSWERGSLDENGQPTPNSHLAFLMENQDFIEKTLKAGGAKILESRLINLNSVNADQTYTLRVVYQPADADHGVEISIQTTRKIGRMSASVVKLEPYEMDLLRFSTLRDDASKLTRQFGDLQLGKKVTLKDLDIYNKGRASIDVSGELVRGSFERDARLTTKLLNKDGRVETDEKFVSTLKISNHTLYLDKEGCNEPDCYTLVGVLTNRFFRDMAGDQQAADESTSSDENSAADGASEGAVAADEGSEGPAESAIEDASRLSLEVCGDLTIALGMSKKAFRQKMLGRLDCPLSTVEGEFADGNKTIFFLPTEQIQLNFFTDNETRLSSVLFYKGGDK